MPSFVPREDTRAGTRPERQPATRLLTVVIHDVAPATQSLCQQLIDTISYGRTSIPLTLLVVPRYHGQLSTPSFEHWLDQKAGQRHELALHGFTHHDEGTPSGWLDRLRRFSYTAGEGEFSVLNGEEAARRLQIGRQWFAKHDWPLQGFVAPAWLMSSDTRAILPTQGFSYTATLAHLIDLPSQRTFFSQSIVYSTRSAWRRRMSVAWNAVVSGVNRSASLVRLELHPDDMQHPRIVASWRTILSHALNDRQPVTVSKAVERLAMSSRWGNR